MRAELWFQSLIPEAYTYHIRALGLTQPRAHKVFGFARTADWVLGPVPY